MTALIETSFGPRFLTGCGETGSMLHRFDWAATTLGPIASWPAPMKTTVGLALRSPAPVAMLWGADGVMIYNDAYSVVAGARHPGIFGSKVREGWPEAAAFNDHVMKVCLSGGVLSFRDQEFTLERHGSPEKAWLNLDYSPVLDESGAALGVIAILVDVTDRVLAERRQRLLVDEMNHRVKNTLATVQAVIKQTLRGADSLETAGVALGDRILALARAQDLLTSESWTGAEVGAVVRAAVGAHGAQDRFAARGPELRLGARPALALALALHELGTNATKYGALSTEAGRVAIDWSAGPTEFALEWREIGGPEVNAPARRGFGSTLIERYLAAELGGAVSLDYAPSGLVMRLNAPLASVMDRT